MGLVFRKTRKLKKSGMRARKQKFRKTITRQSGGVTIINNNPNPRMIINYLDKPGRISKRMPIRIPSGQQTNELDLTDVFNEIDSILNNKPTIKLQDLESGKQYLLTMTDPDAIGKTWTHWVVLLDSSGTIIQQIVEYNGPSPPSGSGVHRYIFQLYDINTLDKPKLHSSLNMSRGDYFAISLEPIIKGKQILEKAVFIIDSSRILKK